MRRFGGRRAVAGVDVELMEGECLAVLGPNGAGKTTLLRMLATLLRPDAGELVVAGYACPRDAMGARRAIGYLGHDPLLYLDLTALQNLELYADLYGVPRPKERVWEALEVVDLPARAYDPVRGFSRGMAQRLGIARMMLHEPSLLLLDEPYAGLDAAGVALLDRLLADARGRRGVVMVTHEVERGVELADQVMVMRAGRAILREPADGADGAAFRARYRALVA